MKALLVPLGGLTVACSRVRIYQHLPFLTAHGVTTRVVPFFLPSSEASAPRRQSTAQRVRDRLWTLRRALRVAVLAPAHDVVLMQRVLLPPGLSRLIARRSRRLVFDFDDAIYTAPDNESRSAAWIVRAQSRFAAVLRASAAALASTPYLVERARPYQPASFEMASAVDCERYRPRPAAHGPGVVIGWIGSASTTDYLAPLWPVLDALARRYPSLRVVLVGAAAPRVGAARDVRAWTLDGELGELARFDVGLMPLPDSEWARGKAGYKLLQYMACGIPCVASPVGHNLALVRHGETGLLADDAAAWEAALATLIESPGLRERLGRAGRAAAEREHSLRVWAPRLREHLDAAIGAR